MTERTDERTADDEEQRPDDGKRQSEARDNVDLRGDTPEEQAVLNEADVRAANAARTASAALGRDRQEPDEAAIAVQEQQEQEAAAHLSDEPAPAPQSDADEHTGAAAAADGNMPDGTATAGERVDAAAGADDDETPSDVVSTAAASDTAAVDDADAAMAAESSTEADEEAEAEVDLDVDADAETDARGGARRALEEQIALLIVDAGLLMPVADFIQEVRAAAGFRVSPRVIAVAAEQLVAGRKPLSAEAVAELAQAGQGTRSERQQRHADDWRAFGAMLQVRGMDGTPEGQRDFIARARRFAGPRATDALLLRAALAIGTMRQALTPELVGQVALGLSRIWQDLSPEGFTQAAQRSARRIDRERRRPPAGPPDPNVRRTKRKKRR